MVRRVSARPIRTTPVVLMGYLNPLEVMGYEAFAAAASAAGVDGVLTVDIPPEEGESFVPALKAQGIDPIFLLAPTSHRARIERDYRGSQRFRLLRLAQGRDRRGQPVARQRARKARRDPPVHRPAGRRRFRHQGCADGGGHVAQFADAVVVGSALVSRIEANLDKPETAICRDQAATGARCVRPWMRADAILPLVGPVQAG